MEIFSQYAANYQYKILPIEREQYKILPIEREQSKFQHLESSDKIKGSKKRAIIRQHLEESKYKNKYIKYKLKYLKLKSILL